GDGFVNLPSEECDGQFFCKSDCMRAPCYNTGCPYMEYVDVSGGSFLMGSTANLDSIPMVQVSVRDFKISKHEVTVGSYRRCVNAGACTAPSFYYPNCTWTNDIGNDEQKPMSCITWPDANNYAQWVGGRLLSEAEWEYAATNAGRTTYSWGNQEINCILSNGPLCINNSPLIQDVCSATTGNSFDDVCDLNGSVIEWVQDEYIDNYSQIDTNGFPYCGLNNCMGEGTFPRVIRGGNGAARDSRYRYRCNNRNPCNHVGIRVGK
ncbi:MAG: formylglycine-generating enzyme family protein, partial [Deltaproteobacteria bacterium]|nr:formylglycine-generating enzyme family protein [Deltaproteobacteria bacterium]